MAAGAGADRPWRRTGTSFEVLQAYLVARATFSAEDLAFVKTVFVPRRLAAGEFLQRGGEVARHAAFVAHGCLRSFVIDAKGKEHVVQFAPEEWWLADAISLNSGSRRRTSLRPSRTPICCSSMPPATAIVDRVPGYSAAMRAGLQKHAAAKDLRIVKALSASAEERYLDFIVPSRRSPSACRSGWWRHTWACRLKPSANPQPAAAEIAARRFSRHQDQAR